MVQHVRLRHIAPLHTQARIHPEYSVSDLHPYLSFVPSLTLLPFHEPEGGTAESINFLNGLLHRGHQIPVRHCPWATFPCGVRIHQ